MMKRIIVKSACFSLALAFSFFAMISIRAYAFALPSTATLVSLQLSVGELSPGFASDTTEYTASVDQDTTSIQITPTATDSSAAIVINGSIAVSSGKASEPISLFTGDNVITVGVTSADGSVTYTITVTRSETADLSSLSIAGGTISPGFTPDNTEYTVEVTGTTATISVTPVAVDSGASIHVNGKAVASGAASDPIPLLFGETTITIGVTSRDGSQSRTYTLAVHRPYNLYLSALTLNQGALEPGFDIANTTYTVNLGPSVASLSIRPTFSDAAASVTVNGKTVSNAALYTVALIGGKNTITIAATSPDRSVTKTYVIYAYRHAGTWQKLGGAVKVDNDYATPSLTFLGSIPYVANCVDRVYVSKLSGTSWSALPQVTGANTYVAQLGLKVSGGIPYVAISGGRIANTVVYKYTNSQWKWASASQLDGSLVSFCEYKGTLYAACKDINTGTIYVKKYTGTSWAAVGAGMAMPKYDSYAVLDVDQYTGVPYLSYEDDTHVYLKKFNGSSWVSVGGAITIDFASRIDLSVYNGIPYVANMNGVYKLNGSTWQNLGRKLTVDTDFDLLVNKGVPYIVFNDVYDGSKITLQKYNGTDWENVGIETFAGQRLSLQFYSDTPYITFVRMNYTYVIRYVQAINANLSSISVKSGSKSYALSPAFSASTVSYKVSVPYTVSSVAIAAGKQDAAAGVTGTGTKTLAFGLNTVVLTVKSGNGAVTKTYTLKITRVNPPKPSVSALTTTPAATYGFTPGGTNSLQIKATVSTAVPAPVTVYIYNASGKWVAALRLANQTSGTKTFYWNGKATAGNAAKLATGAYVPASSAGTKYTIKVLVSNAGGSTYSSALSRKLYSNPTISGFAVTPKTFMAIASGANKAKISYKVNHMTNVEVRIVNKLGKIVAVYKSTNVKPGKLQSVYWNGKATAGNKAGLAAGALVPAGGYKVQIIAGKTTYRPTTVITVK